MAGTVGQGLSLAGDILIPGTMDRLRRPGMMEQAQRQQQVGDIQARRLLGGVGAEIGTPETKKYVIPRFDDSGKRVLGNSFWDQPNPDLIEKGNIDLTKRPSVPTGDGRFASVRTAGFNFDGKEVNLPTVSDDGRLLSDEEAVELYRKTGKHLGIYKNQDAAAKAADALHLDQEAMGYGGSMLPGKVVGKDRASTVQPLFSPSKKMGLFSQAFPELGRELTGRQLMEQIAPRPLGKDDFVGTPGAGGVMNVRTQQIVPGTQTGPEASDIERRARAAGYMPGTVAYQDFIKTATLRPNSVTNVNMPEAKGDVAYQEQMGKLLAQEFTGLQTAGTAAQTSLAKFDRLGGLLESVDTGAFKGTTTQMKAIAKSAGVDLDSLGITDDVAPAQAAAAITNEIALQLRNPAGGAGMPGAMSDKDREFLLQMVPSLETWPGGNKTLVDYWRRINKRSIDIAKMSREYTRKNGGRFDYEFYDELADYAEKNSLFPEADKAAPTQNPSDDVSLDSLLDIYSPRS